MIDWNNIRAGVAHATLDTDAVAALDEYITRAFPAAHGLLAIKNAETCLARSYDDKVHLTDLHPLRSVTKSVVSALIGIAIENGHIRSVDQRLDELLPDAAGTAAGNLDLHQLLSMTGGMLWQSGRSGIEPMHTRFTRSPNWVQNILSIPVNQKNHSQFQYNTGLSHLLSAVISARTGMNAATFAEQTLFHSLGISQATWPADPQNINYGGWGLELSCIDMAKFGWTYACNGVFEDRPVLSSSWIAKSTQAHTPGYGYQWWLYDFNGETAYCAEGLGGQTIAVVPGKKTMIALTSGIAGRSRNQVDLIREHVYPLLQVVRA